jgi:hypothetical protein
MEIDIEPSKHIPALKQMAGKAHVGKNFKNGSGPPEPSRGWIDAH